MNLSASAKSLIGPLSSFSLTVLLKISQNAYKLTEISLDVTQITFPNVPCFWETSCCCFENSFGTSQPHTTALANLPEAIYSYIDPLSFMLSQSKLVLLYQKHNLLPQAFDINPSFRRQTNTSSFGAILALVTKEHAAFCDWLDTMSK